MTILMSVDIKRISSDPNPLDSIWSYNDDDSIWPDNDDFSKNPRQSWFFYSDL